MQLDGYYQWKARHPTVSTEKKTYGINGKSGTLSYSDSLSRYTSASTYNMEAELLNTLLPRDDDQCRTDNEYDGHMGLRISSIFVILVSSMMGATFPVLANHLGKNTGFLWWAFFVAKYFGSGVIIATSFIHLLAPAETALRHKCLTGPITEYSWAEGIILMTIVVLFFVEMMVMRFSRLGADDNHRDHHDSEYSNNQQQRLGSGETLSGMSFVAELKDNVPSEDHLAHVHEHSDVEIATNSNNMTGTMEEYAAQLTSVFILEFGIIFHSVFIGLTLAVSGSEFVTLYIVLAFHQTFEGLGLGSRLATIPWPRSKRFTPYLLAIAFGLTTPIAIAIGLGVRQCYKPGGQTTLIVNGIFDSISAGILIYTALIELLAHEFLFSSYMQRAPFRIVIAAFVLLCLGATLMALLGKWV